MEKEWPAKEGRTYCLYKNLLEKEPEIRLGENINFSDSDGDWNAYKYCLYGFSVNEHDFTWSDGNKIRMILKLSDFDDGCVFMNFDVGGIFYRNQSVIIKSNGKEVYNNVFSKGKGVSVKIDNIDENKKIDIEIILPNALSPKSVGVNEDVRVLAIQLKKIWFSKTASY